MKKSIITTGILFFMATFVFSQTCVRNNIKTRTIKVEGITEISQIDALSNSEKQISINYFDGLGRSSLTVNVAGSPDKADIIQPVFYDDFGRQALNYLPYTKTDNNGNFITKATVLTGLEDFYGTPNCYAETKFDNSPLNKVVEQIPQGDVARSENVSVKVNYLTNTGTSEVIKWKVDNDQCVKDVKTYYPVSTLYVTETEDENGNFSREYKNGQGQVILKASKLNGYWLKTYYVYDDFGLLRFVIPPKASKQIENGSSYASESDKYCYEYKYDGKKRMIEKKLPGAEPVFMIYDNRDLLILTQDGNMRADNKWLFTKYDASKRPVITGTYTDNIHIGQEDMQGFITQTQSQYLWEEYDTDNHIYTNRSFPDSAYSNNCRTLSETYYDSYDYLQNNPDYAYTDVFKIGRNSAKTKGMVTVSKTKILDHRNNITPDYILTVNYYDKYGRTIQTVADNHLEGKDIISNKYNFAGELLETKQSHTIAGSPEIVLNRIMHYDHAGRLLNVQEQINDEDTVIISASEYNERNELETKKLYSAAGSTNFLQEINYQYNIRGWMTFINNPTNLGNDFFAMQLKYETGQNPQFNGNISAMVWNSSNFSGVKTYEFDYDDINRLETADYTPNDRYNAAFTYDYNGNIETIVRDGKKDDGNFGNLDNLILHYDGNQLLNVNDNVPVIKQENIFSDRGSVVSDDKAEYFYDANGNMTKDLNKQIENITYNHLNLPETIEITANNKSNYIYYSYDAAGIKLRKTAGSTTTDYIGNFVYENGFLKYILTDYGRLFTDYGTGFKREFNITDHLGNVRVTFNENGTVQQEDSYYPYGLTMNGLDYLSGSKSYEKNKYLYNGKELQEDYGLDWYDYGARFYDAQLGRFPSLDPLANKFVYLSPYNYASNNPVTNIDLWGLQGVNSNYKPDVSINYFYQRQKTYNEIGNAVRKYEPLADLSNQKMATIGPPLTPMQESIAMGLPADPCQVNAETNVIQQTISGGTLAGIIVATNPDLAIEASKNIGKSFVLNAGVNSLTNTITGSDETVSSTIINSAKSVDVFDAVFSAGTNKMVSNIVTPFIDVTGNGTQVAGSNKPVYEVLIDGTINFLNDMAAKIVPDNNYSKAIIKLGKALINEENDER